MVSGGKIMSLVVNFCEVGNTKLNTSVACETDSSVIFSKISNVTVHTKFLTRYVDVNEIEGKESTL